jgi:hypothetical protein
MTGVAKYFESMNGCQVNIYFGVQVPQCACILFAPQMEETSYPCRI